MHKNIFFRKLLSVLLCVTMVASMISGIIPAAFAQSNAVGSGITTVADPETLTRPESIYGDTTKNAGKITVGKSVAAAKNGILSVTANGKTVTGTDPENFLVTITQTAQVFALSTESQVPLDVVFILDTSGSMKDNDRAESLLEATNTAISSLLAANDNTRIGVVAFSDNNSGGGSSNNAAANVLSSLRHYDDTSTVKAASAHLTWTTYDSVNYIQGRDTVGYASRRASRAAHNGGTNIHAGILLGAEMLMNETSTTATLDDGSVVNRMPVLVLVSDGQPTYIYNHSTWYDPGSSSQEGPGSGSYEGCGFLAALTAAYYKGAISEKYYGTSANENRRCLFYTVGVEIEALDDYTRVEENGPGRWDDEEVLVPAVGDNQSLAEITLNPSDKMVDSNGYYVYGNTWDAENNGDKKTDHSFKTYWSKYSAATAASFSIRTKSNDTYTLSANSITATKNFVMGKNSSGVQMYEGGLGYNDQYFNVTSASNGGLASAFNEMVNEIQLKAISSPTHVTDSGHFSGYVNFYDPIGEYMEVKDMKGILANGKYYQGLGFASLLASGADDEFNKLFKQVLTSRLALTESNIDVDRFIADARVNAAGTNSFCWWGTEHDVGEEDIHMQVLGSAKDDSIQYIQSAAAPAGATHVCRSYFFYGTAGSGADDPDHDYLYFVVRVQRSLKAPYQQTVCISAPANLLSVEQVFINEDVDGNTTASVTKAEPARVIYEVGLRSDINAQNVAQIVDAGYAAEAPADGKGSVNYDPTTGTYQFFTNDWNRSESLSSHHRAQAKATFDAASDNPHYVYQKDTPLLVSSGDSYVPYTGTTLADGTYYYAREYYDWTGAAANADGTYPAVRKTAYIAVKIANASNAFARATDGSWYIRKGVYAASTLQTTGDDTVKSENRTGTSSVVVHPHRTDTYTNSHYTVLLGNNGKLSLVADPVKSVSGTRVDGNATIQLTDGSVIKVGDQLTYTIRVVNNESAPADALVTDQVPAGTKFISAANGGVHTNGTVSWSITGIPAKSEATVSFTVEVTEAVLDDSFLSVDNAATVKIGNDPAYKTNTTKNPPVGKEVEGTSQTPNPENGVQAGDELIYRVRYANGTNQAATVTVTDVIPAGTVYLDGTASHNGEYKDGKLTWTIENVQPGTGGIVSFRVLVTPNAATRLENTANIQIGTNGPAYETNPVYTNVYKGDLKLTKTVTVPNGFDMSLHTGKTFTLLLTEKAGHFSGLYAVSGTDAYTHVLFENGHVFMADANGDKLTQDHGIAIRHGQTITIHGMTAGTNLAITEKNAAGYTTLYAGDLDVDGTVTIPATGEGAAAAAVASFSVTNAYSAAPAAFQLKGTKKLTGPLVEDTTFTFTSQACDANGTVMPGAETVVATATVSRSNQTAEFAFGPRSFAAPGVYRYLITETQSGVNGVKYDTTRYLLTVTVTDNGSGTLAASQSIQYSVDNGAFQPYTGSAVAFSNEYVPADTQLTLQGKKELTNLDLTAGLYSFVVKDGAGKIITSGVNKADGSIEFRPITYSTADLGKTYTYDIYEVNNNLPGITYDTKSYTVEVTITDNGGQLVATPTYVDGDVVFTNVYDPGKAFAQLHANKILTGERTAAEAGEFSFEVKDAAGTVVASGTNAADGSVAFSTIGYTLDMLEGAASKTFTYTITEVIPDLGKNPFIEYSTERYTAEVTVTYDSTSGKLEASAPVYQKDGNAINSSAPAFTNVVNKDYVVEVPADLTKETTGNPPAGTTFGFSVINTDTGTTVGTGIGQANGAVTFTPMQFNAAGTYTFWVQETNAGNTAHGITYDGTKYLLKIVVIYDAENCELKVSEKAYYSLKSGGDANSVADYTEPLTAPHFKNNYAASGSVAVKAGKDMNGRGLRAGEFTFLLEGNGVQVNGTMDERGNVTFAPLYFSESDIPDGNTHTLVYTMREIIPQSVNKLPGVDYDDQVYTVEITLTDDDAGNITANVVYKNAAGEVVDKPVFTNDYHPVDDTTATITVSKELTGRPLDDDEFAFELIHVTDQGQNVVEVATNKNDGTVQFVRTYFAANFPANTQSMQVKYLIREVNGGLGGVNYSDAVYGVVVTVENDTQTGKLVVNQDDIKYYRGSDFQTEIEADQLVFTNKYQAQGATFTPEGSKVLVGRTMVNDEFAFSVKEFDLETGIAGNVVSTGLSAADGTIGFTPIGYPDVEGTNTKTFYYQISETKGNLGGVTYTDKVYYLAVTVTDEGTGSVEANGTYYTGYDAATHALTGEITAEEVVFTNTYIPAVATVQLKATKTLTGRPLLASEFDFAVAEMDGDIVAYGTNTADGQVVFGTMSFTAADTYTYTIYELTPSDAAASGITLGSERFRVTVTVTDVGVGQLEAAVKYEQLNSAGEVQGTVDTPAFTNTYRPDGATVSLQAFKTLTNKDLVEGEFTFTLTGEGQSQSVTNQANGLVQFRDLTYTVEDLAGAKEKTFYYTVKEMASASAATGTYTFDNTVYTAAVTVTDNGTGKLITSVTYFVGDPAEGNRIGNMDFVNSYVPKSISVDLSAQIGATKTMDSPVPYKLTGGEFAFALTDLSGHEVAAGTNGASGADGTASIAFDKLTFNTAGIYWYRLTEKSSTLPGVTTSVKEWMVHVQVRYDHSTGLLYIDDADIAVYDTARAVSEAAFVNKYEPKPIHANIQASKTLEGRPLVGAEFLFQLVDRSTGVVTDHVRNNVAGQVNFTVTYHSPGVYTYDIVEVNEGKGGITYSTNVGSATVTVTDSNLDGKLEASVSTSKVDFENSYTAADVTAQIVANKQVLTPSGITYRLNGGEFTFRLEGEGENKTQSNAAGGQVRFDLTYTHADLAGAKSKEFHYTLSEVIPEANKRLPGIRYSTQSYNVTVTVTDNYDGTLSAVVTNDAPDGALVISNTYDPDPATYQLEAKKVFEGSQMETFTFILSQNGTALQTKSNKADGKIVFDQLTFASVGTYELKIQEQLGAATDPIRYDRNVYTVTLTVEDDHTGKLFVNDAKTVITSENGRDTLVFRNVHHDVITKKDVFIAGDTSVSINGKAVDAGDVLLYTISYTNYDAKPVDVVITDTIPQNTSYVDGSASGGGSCKDGVVTWSIQDLDPDTSVTVIFKVKVKDAGTIVTNQAKIVEGENTYTTNQTVNPVTEDKLVKDVAKPGSTVSIDGTTVEVDDILLYTITYTNSDDLAAEVVITDTISKYTSFVKGSASDGGTFANGTVTWNLQLAGGETKTVSFRVRVNVDDVEVSNQATAKEGNNSYTTNKVTNPVSELLDIPDTGDETNLGLLLCLVLLSMCGLCGLIVFRKRLTN